LTDLIASAANGALAASLNPHEYPLYCANREHAPRRVEYTIKDMTLVAASGLVVQFHHVLYMAEFGLFSGRQRSGRIDFFNF
jgi:hypothetical protein